MAGKRKRVVRFDMRVDPAFDARLRRETDVDLAVCAYGASEGDAWAALRGAHVYHISSAKDEVPERWFVTPALLGRCPELVCASSNGAGYDTIDVDACTRAGIAVVNQAGGNAVSVAEHAFGLILALAHRIAESDRRLRRGRGLPEGSGVRGLAREDLMGREIAGKALGIVGIGHVGTRVAALARAFGLPVLATDPYVAEHEIARRGAQPVPLEELLARSDIVSLHCPRNRSTLGMIDAAAFRRMRQGALFVTTARGGIHDEGALLEALRSGHLGGAGLDVWEREPPPPEHPLLACENVVATYHTAGVTHEARRNMAAIAAEQIARVLAGEQPARLVNPEVWPSCRERFAQLFGTGGPPAARAAGK